jgi:hypothetical protein
MKPAPALLALPIALMFASAPFRQAVSQQVADSSFIYPIAAPAYPSGGGPKVLIDEAHNNFHTMSGRFLAFARLLRSDGYVVAANGSKFTRGALDGARILVIANALAPENAVGVRFSRDRRGPRVGMGGRLALADRRPHALPRRRRGTGRGVRRPDVERVCDR